MTFSQGQGLEVGKLWLILCLLFRKYSISNRSVSPIWVWLRITILSVSSGASMLMDMITSSLLSSLYPSRIQVDKPQELWFSFLLGNWLNKSLIKSMPFSSSVRKRSLVSMLQERKGAAMFRGELHFFWKEGIGRGDSLVSTLHNEMQ